MQDYTKQYFLPWMVTFVLTILLVATLWHGHERFRAQRDTIDSLQTVHQQTTDQLRDAKRIANSPTEGLSGAERREVLWATRTIISETKDPSEMVFIGNVIRNRVDLGYRGHKTVRQVILDPYQFSAFNPNRNSRWKYINMTENHVSDSLWREAWAAARFTMTAPREVLPLSNPCINHFAHQNRVVNKPSWMFRMEQVNLGEIESSRLTLYKQNDQPPCQTKLVSR